MLRHSSIPLALASLLLPSVLTAQDAKPPQNGVGSFDHNGQRSEANLIVAEFKDGQFAKALGLAFITYGTAQWKSEYAAQADQMKGKLFRLGKDNWPILDHSAPLDLGGKTIPAGIWYVAIARDDAGKWILALLEPAKVKAAGVWPFAADKAPRAYEIPLTHEKLAKETADKLTIAWQRDQANPTKGTLAITWGDQKVSTAYEVKVPATKADPKDAAGTKK